MKAIIVVAALFAVACDRQAARATAPLTLTGRVVDQAQIIGPSTEQGLNGRLAKLEASTSDQLVVVTTSSLGGKSIEAYGIALGDGWGIGTEKLNNGVLIIVAPAERKIRIEVGLGLEGLLTDATAGTIIQRTMPLFRAGDYEGAISAAVTDVETLLLSDQRRPQPKPAPMKKVA